MHGVTETAGPRSSSWESGPDAWLTSRRFALGLALLVLAAFPGVVLGWESFVFRDFGYYGHPAAHYFRESLLRGELPLWNPLNNFGIPFLAQWSTLVLYPPSLFFVLLPLPWSLNVFTLAHLWLGGFGAFLLARRWTHSSAGAAVAGVAFAFNGIALNDLIWPHLTAALAWMPWVVGTTELAWRHGGRRIPIAALVGALQMLTGGPEFVLLTWAVLGLLMAGEASDRWWHGDIRTGLAFVARFVAVILIVTLLVAAQLLPFLELARMSHRSAQFSTGSWSMPGWGWANFLVPLFHGEPSPLRVVFQPGQLWTSSYYLGIGVLALAILGAAVTRERRAKILALVTLFSLVFALGDNSPLYPWLRTWVPGIGFFRYPVKAVVLAVFAVPLLAGFALPALLSAAAHGRRRGLMAIAGGLGLLTLLVIGIASTQPGIEAQAAATRINGCVRLGFLTVAIGLVVAWSITGAASSSPNRSADNPVRRGGITADAAGLDRTVTNRARPPTFIEDQERLKQPWAVAGANRQRLLLGALVLVLWLDVLTHAPWQNPTVPPSALEPGLKLMTPMPRLGESRAMISSAANLAIYQQALPDAYTNYLCNRLALSCNTSLLDALPVVDGFYSLYLRHSRELHLALYTRPNANLPALMDFLGVTDVTAPGRLFEFERRTNAMPWVTAGQQPLFRDEQGSLEGVQSADWNPRRTVFLPLEAKPSVTHTAGNAHVTLRACRAHEVVFDIEAPNPTFAVISQAWHPAWTATVDEAPTAVWRANHAFQAVAVPAGRHRVFLRYEDHAFRRGAFLSLLTLAGCAAWIGFSVRPRPPSASAPRSASE